MSIRLHYDFLNKPSLSGHSSFGLAVETPDLSLTRTTKRRMVDADGYIRELQAGEAAFTGATFRQNLWARSTPTTAQWSITGNLQTSAFSAPSVVLAEDASAVVIKLDYDFATNTSFGYEPGSSPTTLDVGKTYRYSFYIRLDDGTTPVADTGLNGSAGDFSVSMGDIGTRSSWDAWSVDAVDGTWYRFWAIATITSGSNNTGVLQYVNEKAFSGNAIHVTGHMLEIVPAGTTSAPGAYIHTSGSATSVLTGPSTKGLLVEEARTNICVQSEDFGTTWAPSVGVVNTNQTTAPDGATTADEFVDDGGGGFSAFVLVGQNVNLSTSTAYTVSVFIKQNGLSWAKLGIENMGALVVEAYFDLANGVVGATTGADNTSEFIEDFGNGWYRCGIIFTSDATDGSVAVRIRPANGDNDVNVARDGTSSIYLWGAQLEAGALPTSYIPTTTTSVTRNQDTVQSTDVSWYNSTESSIYSRFSVPVIGGTNAFVYGISDGGTSDRIDLYLNSGTQSRVLTAATGGNAGIITDSTVWSDGNEKRQAVGFAVNDLVMYEDGTQSGTDTTADMPVGISEINVGSSDSSVQPLNGHIAEIAYWDTRLDNDVLDGLSAGTTTLQAAEGGVLERKRRQHYRRQKLRAQGIKARETWAGTYRGRRIR